MTTAGPPEGLGARSGRFWEEVTGTYELDPGELLVLAEVCAVVDGIEALAAVVERDGEVVAGSKGQPRLHPAVTELRGQRALLGRLLGQLDLPDEEPAARRSPSELGQVAAMARWKGTRRGAQTAG